VSDMDALTRVRTRPTCSIQDFCEVVGGLSPQRAYQAVAEDRELAPGVKAFRVGARKIVVPTAPLRRLLQIDPEETP
jgi:hypothetical protein